MKKKIFRTILAVGGVIILLSTILFCTVLLRHYTVRVFDELEMEAVLAARGVELEGEAYLNGLDPENRITWISSDGSVLYDSQANAGSMENHLQRVRSRRLSPVRWGKPPATPTPWPPRPCMWLCLFPTAVCCGWPATRAR